MHGLSTTQACIQSVRSADSTRPEHIADRIVDAILARKLAPGERLGEQPLADLFGVSRTIVREALSRLAARGMVEVNSRRGWFIVQPSPEDAREAFDARCVIETGLLQSLHAPLGRSALQRLKKHVAMEKAAIGADDAGERSFLLGDFHVCLAECAGNVTLADILRDLTARTTLIATLYQSTYEAAASCREHAEIVAALGRGDNARAVDLMRRHIGSISTELGRATAPGVDPLASLRAALAPVGQAPALDAKVAQRLHTSDASIEPAPKRVRQRLFTSLLTTHTTPPPTES